jgi:hypothetical protein
MRCSREKSTCAMSSATKGARIDRGAGSYRKRWALQRQERLRSLLGRLRPSLPPNNSVSRRPQRAIATALMTARCRCSQRRWSMENTSDSRRPAPAPPVFLVAGRPTSCVAWRGVVVPGPGGIRGELARRRAQPSRSQRGIAVLVAELPGGRPGGANPRVRRRAGGILPRSRVRGADRATRHVGAGFRERRGRRRDE